VIFIDKFGICVKVKPRAQSHKEKASIKATGKERESG
jgi:hypothetical protein